MAAVQLFRLRLLLLILSHFVSDIECGIPLDDFINAPDPYYSYQYTNIHETGSNSAGKYDAYLINMTSQQWLNSSYVDKPIWWHYLWIIVPNPSNDIIYKDYATILISGANNNATHYPQQNNNWFQMGSFVATNTKTIVAVIYNVPNQPLLFLNDPQKIERNEAQIMAYSEHVFGSFYALNSSYRYNWIVEFAMTKSVIKAMDTVHQFIYKNSNHSNDIQQFGICGGSKRGMTTWLTAASDKRVKLFIPIVMDLPNEHIIMHHQYKSYNGWTFAFNTYYYENITRDIDTDWMYDFLNASDPFMFFDRYSDKFKLIINGINDEYMMPDDSYYWFQQLLNYSNSNNLFYQMIPNSDHGGTTNSNLSAPTVATFIQTYLINISLPELTWTIDDVKGSGNITVFYKGDTSLIIDSTVWFGRSCSNIRRDFRLYNLDNPCKCGIEQNGKCMNTQSVFYNETLKPLDNMTNNEAMWIVYAPNGIPTDYWSGFELAITIKLFHNINQNIIDIYNHSGFKTKFGELILTTQTSIVPQVFPFADCNGDGCYGVLV